MNGWRTVVAATVLAAMPALSAAPPSAAQAAKDAQEVRDYVLTMDVVTKVAKAHRIATASSPAEQRLAKQKAELAALEAKEAPTEAEQERMMTLGDEIARAEENDGSGDDQGNGTTVTELARRVDATPAAAAAVRAAGLTSREYATALLALMEASLVHAMLQQKLIAQAPPEASKRNLEFVRTHEKEIAALSIFGPEGR